MSVTITKEIEKAETLVTGLKKHLKEVEQIGISTDTIKKLEETMHDLRKKDDELDTLRREVTEKSRKNHELLTELKSLGLACRKAVKQRYEQPDWLKYGVQDKR